MIICEFEFDEPDRDCPKYSMMEVDYYGHVPADADLENHRLSLRKNLETGRYEVYRFFQKEGRSVVAYSSRSLRRAIEWACEERKRVWGIDVVDTVCRHKPPHRSFWCPRQESDEEAMTEDPLSWIFRQLRRTKVAKGADGSE
jgi:hypothetical protein